MNNMFDIRVMNDDDWEYISAHMGTLDDGFTVRERHCKHEWVNVSFYDLKFVCKHCDVDRERWEARNK